MSKSHLLRLLFAAALVAALAIAAEAGVEESAWMRPPACHGSIAECMTDGELEMDSETNRRILAAAKKYVSYGAMRAGTTPCNIKGQSYYNCKAGKVKPYKRSCTTATKCKK